MTARWSLVSTMHGVPETILPCIAHHLQTDAEFLHIYLDAPNPVVQAALATQPRCIVTVCDDTYWRTRPMGRPQGVVRRQLANLRHARRNAVSDWLVHIDSDEFLVPANPNATLSLSQELDTVPSEHEWARIAPLERVLLPEHQQQTIFDGVFRALTSNRALVAAAYGEGAGFLNHGLSGHTRGKVAFRRKTKLTLGLHDLVSPEETTNPFSPAPGLLPPFTPITGTHLLHFEGWTALHWTSKLLRFVEAGRTTGHHRGRRAAISFMATQPDGHARKALFDHVQRLSRDGYELLHRHQLLRPDSLDPSALTAKTFPNTHLDFTAAGFDARLRASDPEFLQRTGL